MRMERALIIGNVAGAAIFGVLHQPAWFATPVAAFLAYIMLEHRALRLRAGSRHWPSEGMIRFTLNTNIGFACWNLLLGGLIHVLGAAVVDLL
jgi:hypothetical protein